MTNFAAGFLFVASVLIPLGSAGAMQDEVDAAIVFAIDTSFSINAEGADLQRQGHAEALRSHEVITAISSGLTGCIAITYVEWSSAGKLRTVLPWKSVCGGDEADDAADLIEHNGDTGLGSGKTSLSYALDAGSLLLDRFPAEAARKIIDISSNGTNNDGLPVADSRQRTVAKGHIVNGIVLSQIEPDVEPDLPAYFSHNVIAGPGSFVIVPERPSDYAKAIRRKLVLEITGLFPSDIGPVAAPWELLAGEAVD